MTKDQRHYENEGAQAAIKALRGRFTTLARHGKISIDTLSVIRATIREHIRENSERKGGLGRK